MHEAAPLKAKQQKPMLWSLADRQKHSLHNSFRSRAFGSPRVPFRRFFVPALPRVIMETSGDDDDDDDGDDDDDHRHRLHHHELTLEVFVAACFGDLAPSGVDFGSGVSRHPERPLRLIQK